MSYKVKLNIFEGPFDLLVYLIESAEMSIYDIRISEITSQYLAYVQQMQEMDVNVAGEFMVLAAALIEIKSRMLLPRIQNDDGEGPEEDPRDELVQKILEYKRFKAAAELLSEQEEWQRRIYPKPQEDLTPYTKEPDELLNLDLEQFVKAFNLFLIKKRKMEEMKKTYARVERQRMSVEARIEQIKNLFLRKPRMIFQELLDGETSRYNIVLTFMSMLELAKQKSISVDQKVNYGEITVALKEDAAREGGLS